MKGGERVSETVAIEPKRTESENEKERKEQGRGR
jgi:hypothetical protein